MRRYRKAGATGAALFEFSGKDIGSDEFFMTDLMQDYSQGVVIEGDDPLVYVDVRVYIAPALPAAASLFVRRERDRVGEERAKVDALERFLRRPGATGELLDQLRFGAPLRRPASWQDHPILRASASFLARRFFSGPKQHPKKVVGSVIRDRQIFPYERGSFVACVDGRQTD